MRNFLSVVILLIFLSACNKELSNNQTSNDLQETDKAAVTYDQDDYGLYKGVIVGSSGIIKLVINDSVVKAFIRVDNATYDTLTSTASFGSGQAIQNALFIGRVSTMKFSVDADGQNPQIISITIEGHSNVGAAIVKETSKQVVYCYEGNYSGSEAGTFNCIRVDSSLIGLAKSSYGAIFQVNGSVSNGNFTAGDVSSGSTFKGTFNGDRCEGTWKNAPINYSGTFKGTKTL